MKFSDLRLSESLVRAVTSEGYEVATPIQAKAIPHVLDGKDVLGVAQTGTGKTAAFALPVLQRLMTPAHHQNRRRVRCLVLSPTRELATQIAESFRTYGQHARLRAFVIFGGVNQNPQVAALRQGVDILVATPGRLVDLMNQGYVDLSGVEVLVLDEADRMLDMGFIHDIRKVVAKVPTARQTLFFSATMPAEIRRLADTILKNPVTVQVTPVASTAERVEQCVYFVEKKEKAQLLAQLVNELPMSRAIVFTRTKHGADKVVRHLHVRGIRSEAIHGNKSQNARQRALDNFKAGRIPVLVATDIASRGIDVDGITHVVNYDITHEPETYVHRIGRTARAGASGMAVSLCDHEERANLRAIERLINQAIPVRSSAGGLSVPVPSAGSDAATSSRPVQQQRPRLSHDAPLRQTRTQQQKDRIARDRQQQQQQQQQPQQHQPQRAAGAGRAHGSHAQPRHPQTGHPQRHANGGGARPFGNRQRNRPQHSGRRRSS